MPTEPSSLDFSAFKVLDPTTIASINLCPSNVTKVHKGLITLPVRFGSLAAFSPDPVFHYLFVKPHDPQYTPIINAHPNINGRSLYISAIPFDSTVHHLRALFTAIGGGRIEAVIFSDEPLPPRSSTADEKGLIKNKKRKRLTPTVTGKQAAETAPWPPLWNRKLHPPGTTAVAVFVDKAACELAMKAVAENSTDNPNLEYFWGSGIGQGNQIPRLGKKRYEDHMERMFPDPEWAQKFVDDSLEAYDARLKAEEEERRRKANEPDEDGFVTVIRSSRPRPPPSAEEIAERLKKEEKRARKGFYPDFYRFQQRELKKEQAKELLFQFEDAKRQVRERKGAR
ncbi:Ribosomal RNA-processing protein 7 [Orbilia oligospora]|uniref:Ribosomal RNA-processing protein 7 n=1 Tax=Orbilia oligospora TaxID=2813651 RepID=A0A7C8R512_ORBOL|nr:Ribosomal RNA-processing protein 7 [Orbilia oligospora]